MDWKLPEILMDDAEKKLLRKLKYYIEWYQKDISRNPLRYSWWGKVESRESKNIYATQQNSWKERYYGEWTIVFIWSVEEFRK